MDLNANLKFMSEMGNVTNVDGIIIQLKASAFMGNKEMSFSTTEISNQTLRFLENQGLEVILDTRGTSKRYIISWH